MKDKSYILRIINYANKITRYMKNVGTYESFWRNCEKIIRWCKNTYPDIKWPNIIGLRNMISHEYEWIDTTIIYKIVNEEIPDLLNMLKKDEKVQLI